MKLRLGFALACLALFGGCPEASDDARRSRGEAGDETVAAEFVRSEGTPSDWVCTNMRPWREDLDLPDYLKNPTPPSDLDPKDNVEAGRERKKKDYIASHEGTLTICRTVLEKDVAANRGTCPICTAMLKEGDARRINPQPGAAVYGEPIQLQPGQIFTDKIEYRLVWKKEDYLTKADEQIASYREWLGRRNLGGIITGWDTSQTPAAPIAETDPQKVLDIYVERAKNRGQFTKDEANPKVLPKFGLPPLAEPLVRCPSCKKPVSVTESRCWNCNVFYTLHGRDERNSIGEPQELLCPFCKQPIDPSINFCTNQKCEKFHRALDREGACWRCGGSGVCPECLGSGKGHGPIEGGDECYLCGGKSTTGGSNGMCPECNGTGFAVYDGALPPGYRGDKRQKNDWKLNKAGAAAPAGGGSEKGSDKGSEKGSDKGDDSGEKK